MSIFKTQLPANSLLHQETYHYYDSFYTILNDPDQQISLLELSKSFLTAAPPWVERLFDFRNKLVKVFGLKTSDKNQQKEEMLKNFNGKPGDKLGFFKVFKNSGNEIIMGENDSHLDFRVSILLEEEDKGRRFTISTTVHFNNWFGKLYFLPVKPFHKQIVPVMMKGMIRSLKKD